MRTKMFLHTILVFALLLSVSASAQDKQKGKHHHMKERWEKLGLTQEQQTKLKELHRQSAPARKEQMKKMGDIREKIKTELLKEKPSQKVLDDYAAQMGNLHKEMNAAAINHLLKVKGILTPEQFKKFTEKGHMGGRGERMRERKGDEERECKKKEDKKK